MIVERITELSAKIVHSLQPLTNFAKSSIPPNPLENRLKIVLTLKEVLDD